MVLGEAYWHRHVIALDICFHALLQQISTPLRLQEVDEIVNNGCQPNPANTPCLTSKPLKEEIRDEIIWLSTVPTFNFIVQTFLDINNLPHILEAMQSRTCIDYFCDVVVQPILDLFYSTRTSTSWLPFTYSKSIYDDFSLVTFHKPRTDPTLVLESEASPQPLPVAMLLVTLN
ncbi:hypothetical protein QCA50_002597 [Cerrena zonata]|uniref:Uncharacterized protein n=1 Tax=Cerrena zonata TaxID=2478898 RepID=A0AAW0GMA0_9APHY